MTSIRQTAAQVTEAYPLFGVGMDQAYLILEEPFHVPAQIVPLLMQRAFSFKGKLNV